MRRAAKEKDPCGRGTYRVSSKKALGIKFLLSDYNNTMKHDDEKKLRTSKIGNIGFLLAVPALLILCIFTGTTFFLLTANGETDLGTGALFLVGFLLGRILELATFSEKTRTWIHESKHAALVILTGGKLLGFRVQREGTGSVRYSIDKDKFYFGPLIALGPYHFPLFSLPVFLGCVYLSTRDVSRTLPAIVLGIAAAIDYGTARYDFRPNQSDLTRLIGGVFVATIFTTLAQFLWFGLALLWVLWGNDAFTVFAAVAVDAALYTAEIFRAKSSMHNS